MSKFLSPHRGFLSTFIPLRGWRVTIGTLLATTLFVMQAGATSYITESTTGAGTVNPAANQYPQYLLNSSGIYGSAAAHGSSTSEVNITVNKVVAFDSSNTFNDWNLLNSSVHIYAAPVFAGGVTYNGSNGDEAGTSVTAINITTDGGTGVNAVVIGAPYADLYSLDSSCGQANSGAVYFFFGHTPLNLSYNLNQANLTICGNETGMLFGWSVASVVNMSGPGGAGVAIGSPGFTYCVGATTNLGTAICSPTNAPHAGAVWAVDRAYLETLYSNLKWSPGMHAVTDIGTAYDSFLADLNAYSDLKGEELGYSVGAVENTTSSGTAHVGYDDILAGAPYLNDTKGNAVGEAFAWNLPTGSVVGFENPSNRTNSHYGWSVGNVSDPGGANRQDVVIGAPGSDTVYVYKGDYWSSRYGVYVGGTTIAEPVLYRIPGRPGTNFGWSVAGINRPANGAKPEVAVGEPDSSTQSVVTYTNNTLAEFASPGSSLPTTGKSQADGVYAYTSSESPVTLNLSSATQVNTFTWTQSTAGCVGSATSPVAIAGTTSAMFTAAGCYEYATTTFPTYGVLEAYVDLATGDCLSFVAEALSGTHLYPEADVALSGGELRYGTSSAYVVQSSFSPVPDILNTWYKVDIVYDNINLQYNLWVNNVLVAENVTYGIDGATQAAVSYVTMGSLDNAYEGGCYGTPALTGYIDAVSLYTITTAHGSFGASGLYVSSYSTAPGSISNVTIQANFTTPAFTSYTLQVTADGGGHWVSLPSSVSAANVSFLYHGGTRFGYRIFFNSSDARYSPQLASVTAFVGYVRSANVGVVHVFGNGVDLNDSGTYSATTWWQFNQAGSSLSNSTRSTYEPYAPGNPSNYTVDPYGTLDNGHLSLFQEDAWEDNFDTPHSTDVVPTGNYSVSAGKGGSCGTLTWSEVTTPHVSSPNGAKFSDTGICGDVFPYEPFTGKAGTVILGGSLSLDVNVSAGEAVLNLEGGSDIVVAVRFMSGSIEYCTTSTTSCSAWSTSIGTYHANVWYWLVVTFTNFYSPSPQTFGIYINNSLGNLVALATGVSFSDTSYYADYFDLTNPDVAATFYVDNVEIGRPVYNGSYVSAPVTVPGYLTGVRVFNNSTQFSGTNLEIEVSRDGGANWSAPITNGSFYAFSQGEPNGKQLRYRILFHTQGVWSPVLYDVSINYYYVKPFVTISGLNSGDQFGYAVSSGGDMDRDSGMDMVVGAPGAQTSGVSTGQVYIFYGTGWTAGSTYTSVNANVAYDGQNSGDKFGTSVYAGAFNVSAPYPPSQLLVGAPFWSNGCASSGTECGRVYLFGSSPPTMEVQLGYTASPHDITFASGQAEVAQQGFQNLVLTMSATTIPIGATLYLNVTNLQTSTTMWGSPILVVWVNSANLNVASYYYCGYYLHAP